MFSAQSPDGKYLASGAIDGIINIFDIATGKLLHTLEGVVHRLFCANWVIRSQRKTYSFIKMLLNGKWALDLQNINLSWRSQTPLRFSFVTSYNLDMLALVPVLNAFFGEQAFLFMC